jgi:hypothetical protein
MAELAPSALIDAQTSPERFVGSPTDVPFAGIEYQIPDAQKDMWKPGIIDGNNGLIAAHDATRPIVHIALQGDIDQFSGYTNGSANVPLSGGDQDGWPGGRYSREVVAMGINAIARERGVKGRTIPVKGRDYEAFTLDPFDKGDFVDMTRVAERTPGGQDIFHDDLVSELSSPQTERNRKPSDVVGRFNSNNGVMSWVTPEGKTQIAPASDERFARLRQLGYEQGDINVPHSNGESFAPGQLGDPAQAFGEIELADMQRKGETMTMDTRNSRFAGVTIPSRFLDVVKH